MQILWLATANLHKQADMINLLSGKYIVKTLADLKQPLLEDIEETGTSFSENALIKARTLSRLINGPAIGDDSGLEIVALDNFPGIYSARWIDTKHGYNDANATILKKMQNITNREAQYICVLAYVDVTKNIEKTFIGVLKGTISTESKGSNGFGYDPIFYLPKYYKTCGEITRAEKNKISHRYLALKQLLKWLESNEQDETFKKD